MKKLIFFSILLVGTIGLSSCMKENCDCDHDPGFYYSTPVLFQYEYYNYAWGFHHSGFLIDNEGRLKGFNKPEKWKSPDSSGFISKDDLKFNLAQCDTTCGQVNLDDLELYFSKTKDIRKGEIVDNGMVMADAGTGVFSAWYWNEKVGKFENVLLVSNGDLSKVNTHRDVKELVAWLRWLGEKTNRFYWYGAK